MQTISRESLIELFSQSTQHCVSLFMPLHVGSREQRQNQIRYKNLLVEAGDKLSQRGAQDETVEMILSSARELAHDEDFWRSSYAGLAGFLSAENCQAIRVPIELEEKVIVQDRFQIRPLLPLLGHDANYFILALTQNEAHLFEATKYKLEEVELPEIRRLELDGLEGTLQSHSHQAPTQGKGARSEAIFHGHGGKEDRTKEDTLRYFQQVDNAITDKLATERAPLLLACVEYLAPIYGKANHCSHLLPDPVPGSPDRWTQEELLATSWKHIEPQFQKVQQQAWEEYQEAASHDKAADKLESVVVAAGNGRIDTLFLTRDQQAWGHVDASTQSVELTADGDPSATELLDYAAAQTLNNGGDVYLMNEIPENGAAAVATLRY